MDVQSQLAKAVQARFKQMNGIEEPTPSPSSMSKKVKEPVTIPRGDPGSKSAAAAALAAKFGKGPGFPPFSSTKMPSPANSNAGPLSSDDEAVAATYRKMLKVGMPDGAVRHKMVADGVPDHIVDVVMKGDTPAPKTGGSGVTKAGGLTPEEEQIVTTYRKMVKVGMPEGAIRHKMSMAGVTSKLQDAVFVADSPDLSGGGGGSSSDIAASSLSPGEEQIASLYRRMMKVGMPEGAVRHKMTADGVAEKIQKSVLAGESSVPPSSGVEGNGGGGGSGGEPVSSLSPDDEAIATQFRKMMKVKMPQGAIIQKMTIAGVPQHIQDSVLKGEVPASEPTPSTAASVMPVNPLAAMIASSGGIGSLKAAAPVEKEDRPSGMPGNPLAAAIAASGGMASLKKAAPNTAPAKSGSNAGGLLGELTASGFKGSLKKSSAHDRAPPKPSSSGGLLGELAASGFKGSLKKTPDRVRAPPNPSSSGGLLGELSASGFKGSLKKTSRVPPGKSASTGNTDFSKLLEERKQQAESATIPKNKLPPSKHTSDGNLEFNKPSEQRKVESTQQPATPAKNSVPPPKANGDSGFGRMFGNSKNKTTGDATPSPPPKKTPPLPPSNFRNAQQSKVVETLKTSPPSVKIQPPSIAPIIEMEKSVTPPQKKNEKITSKPPQRKGDEKAPQSPAERARPSVPGAAVKSSGTSLSDKSEENVEKRKPSPETQRAKAVGEQSSPQKAIAGSHMAAMLSRRQQDRTQLQSASSPIKALPLAGGKTDYAALKSTESSAPSRARITNTEARVPPALAALSQPRSPRQQAQLPPALVQMKTTSPQSKLTAVEPTQSKSSQYPEPKIQASPAPRVIAKAPKPPEEKEAAPARTEPNPRIASALKPSVSTLQSKSTAVEPTQLKSSQYPEPKVQAAPAPLVIAKAPEPPEEKEGAPTRTEPNPRITSALKTSAPCNKVVTANPTPAPVSPPKPQISTEQTSAQLSDGKQVIDVAKITVNADGTQSRERKRKTKNPDKKKQKVKDDDVDVHCACVVM